MERMDPGLFRRTSSSLLCDPNGYPSDRLCSVCRLQSVKAEALARGWMFPGYAEDFLSDAGVPYETHPWDFGAGITICPAWVVHVVEAMIGDRMSGGAYREAAGHHLLVVQRQPARSAQVVAAQVMGGRRAVWLLVSNWNAEDNQARADTLDAEIERIRVAQEGGG